MKYSIVIPCYNSSRTIEEVIRQIEEVMQKQTAEYEVILVNDHSPDQNRTMEVLEKLATNVASVVAIDLAKNVGQHNALMAGFNYASGEFIICMDDDGQTSPTQLPVLISAIKDDENCDVVYGYYNNKKHSRFRNIGSTINYLTVRGFIGKPKELRTSSFFVMRGFVKDAVIAYKHSYSYMQGLILRTTRNIKSVPIEHYERKVGQSNYNLKNLLGLWSNILGFSVVPLRICTYCGYSVSMLSLIMGLVILIRKIFINPNMAAGWPSTIVLICFLFGLLFSFMGLIGEYIGRMFMGINSEPQYVVRKIIGKVAENPCEEKEEEEQL